MKRTEEGRLSMLSVRLDGAVMVRLKVAAAERGSTIQEAVRQAVERWLDAAPRRRRAR